MQPGCAGPGPRGFMQPKFPDASRYCWGWQNPASPLAALRLRAVFVPRPPLSRKPEK